MWSTLLHVLMTAADQVKEAILDLSQAFKDHGRFLARSILRLTGDGPHVEDILQETFIIAHRKQASFESRSSLRTWLYGIASNLCLHHRRSLARELNALEKAATEPTENLAGPEKAVEAAQNKALVEAAMQAIPFKQREIFMLYEIDGMDGPSIAQLVDIPLNTVWSRLRLARETFAKEVRRRRAGEPA